ncbi:unnamed protein product [Colletotrichum noveboracense]|uniref:Heterokaryon incompatibility domain-containing protein n=1 Tax=Colletotrichum noveboracense TaxID=2664923 RepID=A0A9W4S3T7_9PEZI|nr:unnamed protein product [Colletotrichum noveboracense]
MSQPSLAQVVRRVAREYGLQTRNKASNMGEAPDLQTFWYEGEPEKLRCLVCGASFLQDALVRTFKVSAITSDRDVSPRCSRVVESHLGVDILLFDRHLRCLLDAGIPMVTVSHVWDPQISAIQQQHRFSPQTLHVRHLAIENPVRIFTNIEKDPQFPPDSELWHDYFSVPQWTDQLKSRILLTIHRIFEQAHTTIIHFDGLTPAVVDKLHRGRTSHERLSGLTGVCNEKWFTRMWTAMEFVRSRSVRMMTSDFQLVQGDDGTDPAFLGKLRQVWGQEVEAHGGDVWGLEDSVGMRTSENLVPWNLGPLQQVRSLHRTNFAMAFALLSKRGCRDEMDFLHGLRGITQSNYEEPPGPNFRRGYLHVAWLCLLAGDYSPFFMTPNLPMSEPPQEANMFTCYNDVWTWGMGEAISPPDHMPEVSVDSSHEDAIRARLQPIGIVSMLSESPWYSPLDQFAACAEMTLAQTGPDLNDFVATLGTRLFGEDTNSIMQHIDNQGTARDLESMLMSQYTRSEWRPDWRVETLGLGGTDAIMWLADALHLTGIVDGVVQNRLGLMFAHAGTVHNKPHSKIVSVTCTYCHKTSLFRAGLFAPAHKVRLSRAWRIPGLQYQMALKNGMAVLEKDGRVLGRMIWATPACECVETEMVELRMPDLPNPQPYNFGQRAQS